MYKKAVENLKRMYDRLSEKSLSTETNIFAGVEGNENLDGKTIRIVRERLFNFLSNEIRPGIVSSIFNISKTETDFAIQLINEEFERKNTNRVVDMSDIRDEILELYKARGIIQTLAYGNDNNYEYRELNKAMRGIDAFFSKIGIETKEYNLI